MGSIIGIIGSYRAVLVLKYGLVSQTAHPTLTDAQRSKARACGHRLALD
jgi:hypothetical protein